MPAREPSSLARYWTPRYWAIWAMYAWMRLSVLLPLRWQIRVGKRAGSFLSLFVPEKRRVTRRNLQLCFPELDSQGIERLCKEHFEAMGASFAEMAMGWFGDEQTVRDAVRIEGEQHLREALDRGQGVLLYCGHFTTLELYHPALRPLCTKLTAMYRPMRNEMMDEIIRRGRRRNIEEVFSKYSVRALLKALSENAVVYYFTDQSYSGKHSALVPFFGEPAMTNTATTRILKMSGATLLTCFYRRLENDAGYLMNISPPPEDFPSDDPVRDTARLMKELEDYVRTCPEQYAWMHRRFKGRPETFPDVYAKANAA